MRKQIEQLTGIPIDKDETWLQVFDRVNKEQGVDVKTIFQVLVCVLEEIEGKEKEDKFTDEIAFLHSRIDAVEKTLDGLVLSLEDKDVGEETGTTEGRPEETTPGTEGGEVSEGIRGTEIKV